MAQFNVTEEEREVLATILDEYLSDLRVEIHETKDRAFKQGLRSCEQIVERLRRKIAELRE